MSTKTVIDGAAHARGQTSARPQTSTQGAWAAALAVGQQRAVRVQHPILVSYTHSVEWQDPIQHFATAEEGFFWEQPDRQQALVGSGIAARLITEGPRPITEAAAQWRMLLRDAHITAAPALTAAVTGPLLCGGFAFDPVLSATELWADFPAGRLILPALLWRYHAGEVTLTHCQIVEGIPNAGDQHSASTRGNRSSPRAREGLNPLARNCEPLRAESLPEKRLPSLAMMGLDDGAWRRLVATSAQAIRAGEYQKVVLARAETVCGQDDFDLPEVLARLRAQYPGATTFAVRQGARTFLGATPERLAQVAGGRVATMALAGSAPRSSDPTEDAALGAELAQNAKIHTEHAIVISSIVADLAQLCTTVQAADQPRLLQLQNVQHLETPISGQLLANRSILDVVAALHPTPAVSGFPREAALAMLREHERLDRGWYAGPLGWLNAAGDGEFVVALRSALVQGDVATLFAGCGIVGESDPASELAESQLKLQVMRRALGCEE